MKKIPKWGWVAIAVLVVGGYLVYRSQAANAATSSAPADASSPASVDQSASPDSSGSQDDSAALEALLASLGQGNSELEQALLNQVSAFNTGSGNYGTQLGSGGSVASAPSSTSTPSDVFTSPGGVASSTGSTFGVAPGFVSTAEGGTSTFTVTPAVRAAATSPTAVHPAVAS